jgi:hypothetical protein
MYRKQQVFIPAIKLNLEIPSRENTIGKKHNLLHPRRKTVTRKKQKNEKENTP